VTEQNLKDNFAQQDLDSSGITFWQEYCERMNQQERSLPSYYLSMTVISLQRQPFLPPEPMGILMFQTTRKS